MEETVAQGAGTPAEDHLSQFARHDKLLSNVYKTANLMTVAATRWLKKFGVTAQQWSVLATLADSRVRRGMTVNQLSQSLTVSRQHLTVVLNRLDSRLLTERVPDPNDGRIKRVQLTPKGRELFEISVLEMEKFYCLVLKDFDELEHSKFCNLIERLRYNIASI